MSRSVLFVASEATPLVKVGGLADVVGALPSALQALGVDARIIIPRYGDITPEKLTGTRVVLHLEVSWQQRQVPVNILEGALPGTSTILYLLDAPEIFQAGGVYYEHAEKDGPRLAVERFVFFSWAVSNCLAHLPWQPELIHCHDWHTALIPALLPLLKLPPRPTVLTIHNIEGQGKWRPEDVFDWLGLNQSARGILQDMNRPGELNLLRTGIRSASVVNTVSPTYAQEILTSTYGLGLETDLAQRPGGARGILNGIDYHSFDPATDSRIFARYDVATASVGKLNNKRALLSALGLGFGTGPLFIVLGRLTAQKGVDLIPDSLPHIIGIDGRIIILGSGVPEVEKAIAVATAPYPEYCRLILKFDPGLAQQMYAAADFFLMPSRFEPCGLGQLVAMRYGAIPIVRDTGGLHDTVRDLRRYRDGAGLVFGPATSEALQTVVQDALRIFGQPDTMLSAQQRAMSQDFSWNRSAKEYLTIYAHAS